MTMLNMHSPKHFTSNQPELLKILVLRIIHFKMNNYKIFQVKLWHGPQSNIDFNKFWWHLMPGWPNLKLIVLCQICLYCVLWEQKATKKHSKLYPHEILPLVQMRLGYPIELNYTAQPTRQWIPLPWMNLRKQSNFWFLS